MIQEFKDFIMKGNVLELAVAVIIAGAFGAVITTFTNDVLMPPIGMALGGVDFSELKMVLQEAAPAVMEGDKVVKAEVAEVAVRWGKWVKTIIDFLIIAFILFLIIKGYNKTQEPPAEEAPAGPTQEELLAEIRDLLRK